MKKFKQIKLIASAALASVSLLSNAEVETRDLNFSCDSKFGRAVVVEKRQNKYHFIYIRSAYKRDHTPIKFYAPFLYGDSFGLKLGNAVYIPSDDISPSYLSYGADEAVVFQCKSGRFHTGGFARFDISADTYDLLIKQKWLSK